jgi:hypothetical protein
MSVNDQRNKYALPLHWPWLLTPEPGPFVSRSMSPGIYWRRPGYIPLSVTALFFVGRAIGSDWRGPPEFPPPGGPTLTGADEIILARARSHPEIDDPLSTRACVIRAGRVGVRFDGRGNSVALGVVQRRYFFGSRYRDLSRPVVGFPVAASLTACRSARLRPRSKLFRSSEQNAPLRRVAALP